MKRGLDFPSVNFHMALGNHPPEKYSAVTFDLESQIQIDADIGMLLLDGKNQTLKALRGGLLLDLILASGLRARSVCSIWIAWA